MTNEPGVDASTGSRPQVLIWRQPRAAFRQLLETHTRDWSWVLIMAAWATGAAFLRAFDSGAIKSLPLWLLVVVCVASGLIFGPLQAYLMTAFLRLVGRLSDKPGTFRELRTAYAWSFLPNAVAGLLLSILMVGMRVVALTIGGGESPLAVNMVAVMALVAFAAVLVGWVWSLILLVIGVGEAHRTTTAEGFFQVLGAVVVLFVTALIVVGFVIVLMARTHS
ncbi:MAG TPA: Yip1 family protein [Gemmatimonadales bacterium]|nr:Yip1 family protein [Gemmatimonadales bacterium]